MTQKPQRQDASKSKPAEPANPERKDEKKIPAPNDLTGPKGDPAEGKR